MELFLKTRVGNTTDENIVVQGFGTGYLAVLLALDLSSGVTKCISPTDQENKKSAEIAPVRLTF